MSRPRKAEREHMARVSEGGCVVCWQFHDVFSGPCEVHHVGSVMGRRASHFDTIGLCADHHRNGGYGVAIHAGKEGFEKSYGSERDLLKRHSLSL